MTTELRRFIQLVFELILLGSVVTFVVLGANIGRTSLNIYVAQQDSKDLLPPVVSYTKGSMGYYEIVDLIDSYAPTTDIVVKYKNNVGDYSTMVFTTAIDGKTVKLAVGDTIPQKGVPYTGVVYSRVGGVLYRNGIQTTTQVLETDMKIPLNSLKAMNNLYGNGVLDYNFIEVLFDWARDVRFVCTIEQTYETNTIDRITLQMQK